MASLISVGVIAENRRARHDYDILETLEAGLVLTGSEVKSLRQGRASIAESYAGEVAGALMLINATIPIYEGARENHDPKRHRALLVSKKERNKLLGQIQRDGMTAVPLKLYFNKRGLAKLLLGLAAGRKKHDKREAIKQRDWDRQKARLLKGDQ